MSAVAQVIIESFLKLNETCSLIWDLLSRYDGLNDDVQMLKEKLEELCSQEADVTEELEHAELQRGRKRKRKVENWLTNVQRKKFEVYALEQNLRDGGLLTHLKLTVQVKKLTGEVEELVERGRFSEGLVLRGRETRRHKLLTTKIVGKMFQKNVCNIWEWLVNDEVLMIGVYGMGGVGKTSLIMHTHDKILTRVTNFSDVFWVTVSQSSSIRKLQNDVAKVVGLNFCKENDEKKRAARLSQAFMRWKKCVLILDDVWCRFPLEQVGIPARADGLKLIMTSRSLDVCRRMSCQKYVKVEPLSEEEAWSLFVDNLGQQTTLSPEIRKVARSIAKECAGLPLGIITMARSMRGVEDVCEWRDALEKLRSEIRQEEMEMEVFRVLRFSYDRLNDKILQECFLYCALYPEDFEINREILIENFIDEGLVNGRKSLESVFDEGYTILNKLENNCLLGKVENYIGGNKCFGLQDSSSHIAISMLKKGSQYMAPIKNAEGYYVENQVVKMHDLMRTLAISIIKAKSNFMVKAGLQLIQIPDEEEWTEDLEKVSLMSNWIHEIPAGTSPRCPRLRTLILKQNESLTRISDSFFAYMPALQVLDLSFTDIEILPNSVSDLKTLTALLLTSCKRLRLLPSLANLQALIRLDLSYTAITDIPQGLEMLTNLTWLNLYAKCLKMSAGKGLAKLTRLKFLILHWWSRNIKVKAEDISGLRKLETFAGNLYDRHHFNAYVKVMQNSGPKNYLLQLDSGEFPAEAQQIYFTEVCFSRDVIITSCSLRTGEIPLMLPRDAQRLKIERCHDVKSLCDILSLKNATSLRRCEIVDCEGQEYLLSLSCLSPCCNSHKNLESVELSNLKSLRCLCKEDEGVAQSFSPKGAFTCVKYFCVYHCPKITKLLTPGMLANLQNLEEITVHNCESIKEIISVTATEDIEGIDDKGSGSNPSGMDYSDLVIFTHPKLVSLSLKHLPELQCICRGLMVCESCRGLMVCESLQKFRIYRCPKLMLPLTVPPVQTLYDSF